VVRAADLFGGSAGQFGGEPVSGDDALVSFTHGGDANLDGKINVDDYGRIDFNVALGTTGWFNGDFNYDGKINVDDYGIIDFNVGIQVPILPGSSRRVATAATPVGAPQPRFTEQPPTRRVIVALLENEDSLF
jgi:hypothetical protein